MNLLRRLLDGNEREVERLRQSVAAINSKEPELQSLRDEQLRERIDELRARVAPFTAAYDEAREARRQAKDPAEEDRTNALVRHAYRQLEEALELGAARRQAGLAPAAGSDETEAERDAEPLSVSVASGSAGVLQRDAGALRKAHSSDQSWQQMRVSFGSAGSQSLSLQPEPVQYQP